MTTREVALRNLTKSIRWVVLDVETANSDEGKRVLSVGITQWRQDVPTGQAAYAPIEWFVDPGCPIDNTRFHGITTKMLAEKQAQPFSHVIPKLNRVLAARRGEKVVLVAHYARFDVGVLHLEYGRENEVLPDVPVLDTWALAGWLNVAGRKRNLGSLLNHYGLALTKHHDAAADAQDTAELLRRLINDAATQGVTDFTAPHPTTRKDAVQRRTGDYDAAPANRGIRAARRSPFAFVERPIEHDKTHKPLPKNPTGAQVASWWDEALVCVALRCPGLHHKVDALRVEQERTAGRFLDLWQTHLANGQAVTANTVLGAAFVLLPKVTPAAAAPAWVATWEPLLLASERCAIPAGEVSNPVDACPDCRADRACPGDTWPALVAKLLVGAGRNFNFTNTGPWRATRGRLDELVEAGQRAYASEAAWQVYEMLTNQKPDAAASLVELADSLRLTHPRITQVKARHLELVGDHDAALALIDASVATRGTSSDRAWVDLLSHRDAVASRKAALARIPSTPPQERFGHSAPADRPDPRRFTLSPPAPIADLDVGAPLSATPKPRARKRRAFRAGR